MKNIACLAAVMSLILVASCGKDEPKPASAGGGASSGAARPEKTASGEPAVITVEHILIGVKGGQAGSAKREQAEAERVAQDLLRRARSGEDFLKLRDEFTEDPGKGPYIMTNIGIEPADSKEFPRARMAKAFGDVSFRLEIGQTGITEYDLASSPFGYHIIKRVK